MRSKRLELALEKITAANWERFERFASEFLAVDLPELRTVAAPSGDGGRDAELFSPTGDNTQVLQYSVAQDWKSKIKATAKRVSETIHSAQLLIYVTNQLIGADADELKRELRTAFQLHLDVRDRSYFLERYRKDLRTEAASEELAQDIVDPFLASEGILVRRSPVLDSNEAKAAHVYLSLQLRDEIQEKGLTKLSFEALIRSALINTNSENRMHRDELKRRIRQLLPSDSSVQIDQLVDSAIARLTKRAIRHWKKEDEFCLTYEETQRVAEFAATQELAEISLGDEIRGLILRSAPAGSSRIIDVDVAAARIRRILERCLYARAESFASAVQSGNIAAFATDHLETIVQDDLRLNPAQRGRTDGDPSWLTAAVREIVGSPGQATQRYLRDLADAYTLLSFLRQTPDVQSAVQKMFSHGEIWLDTSAILPLLAEELLDEDRGQFQQMVELAGQAGIRFLVTDGVVEELDRHINRASQCARNIAGWQGRIPFLLEAFLQAGRPAAGFASWTEVFRGPNRPVDDIFEFLNVRFGIDRWDLEARAAEAPTDFRQAVQEAWYHIHERRRQRLGVYDTIVVNRLSRHDTENYVGVIQQRQQEKPSPFGYSAWWLTLDRSAFKIGDIVRDEFGVTPIPDSPVMSLDFLAQYLTFGPIRSRVSKSSLRELPVALEPRFVRFLNAELLEEASRIRAEMKNLPEHVIRRRVRDHLDEARRRVGPLAYRGVETVLDEIGQ